MFSDINKCHLRKRICLNLFSYPYLQFDSSIQTFTLCLIKKNVSLDSMVDACNSECKHMQGRYKQCTSSGPEIYMCAKQTYSDLMFITHDIISLSSPLFLSIPPSRRLHENQIMLQLCELYKMHACFLVQPPSPSPSRDPSILDDGGNNLRGDFFFCPAWGGCKMQEGKNKTEEKFRAQIWKQIMIFDTEIQIHS